MSKLRTIIAAFAAGFAFLSAGMAFGGTYTDGDGNIWTSSDGKIIAVTIVNTTLAIPSAIDGVDITAFDAGVFQKKDKVVRVTIPAGVTAIPDQAFLDCKNLKGVTINATAMTSIGYQAFMGCYNMESFVIPNSVTMLGQGVFSGCSALEEVTIGDGVETLTGVTYNPSHNGCYGDYDDSTNLWGSYGNGMFYNCTSLKKINWGTGLKTIGNVAFLKCTALEKVEIPDTVTAIGNHAFFWCSNLGEVKIGSQVATVGRMAFRADGNLTKVAFGSSVTEIQQQAFQDCVNLQNFTLPATIQYLRYRCFAGCSKALTEVEIPTNRDECDTELEQGVFSGCAKLEQVTLGDTVKTLAGVTYNPSHSGCYGDYDDSTNLWGSYGNGMFYNCTSLKTINWGKGLETIGNIAFLGCSALEKVTLPANVSAIGKHAFYGCSALRTVEVKGSVTSIGRRAFANCANLRYVDFQGPVMAFNAEEEIFAFDKDAVIAYAAKDSTGWTGVAGEGGLPASGTWRGARIMYGPADKELSNPYDFYPYTPTGIGVGWDNYDWPSPLMLTKEPYVHGETVPESVAEFKHGETIYLNYAFDEYWRGNTFENLTNTFALSGAKTAQEDVVRKVTSRDYTYCWGTNVALNILKDLAPGDYTLTMNLNAGRNLAETDYANNTTSLTFRVVAARTYTVSFDAHGGTPAPEARILYEGTAVGELPVVTRDGHTFEGWFTAETGGVKIDATIKVTADITYHAQWAETSSEGDEDPRGEQDPEDPVVPPTEDDPALPDPVVPSTVVPSEVGAAPATGMTYVGYVVDEVGGFSGTFTLIVSKPQDGFATVKVTIIDPITGKKVVKIGTLDLTTGLVIDGELAGLRIGTGGVFGTIVTIGKLEGSADVVKEKDEEGLKVYGNFNKKGCALAFRSTAVSGEGAAFANGYFGLTVTFAAKGKAKVAGVLPDGTKLSLSTKLILGNGVGCLPVSYAKKTGSFGFLLWFDLTKMTVTSMTGITPLVNTGKTPYTATVKCLGADVIGAKLNAGAMFDAKLVGYLPKAFTDAAIATSKNGTSILPNGVAVDGGMSKWKLPKPGKVTLTKDKTDLDVSKFTAKGESTMNPAALKLTYTEKKGTFKGSFALYQDATTNGKPKLKKWTATVNGVVVKGVGYGSAVIKKAGSMPVTVGK